MEGLDVLAEPLLKQLVETGHLPQWDVIVIRRTGREGEGKYAVSQSCGLEDFYPAGLRPFDAIVLRPKNDDRVYVLGECEKAEVKEIQSDPPYWADGIAPVGYPVATMDVLLVHKDGSMEKVRRPWIGPRVRPGDIVFYPPYVGCDVFDEEKAKESGKGAGSKKIHPTPRSQDHD